MIVVDVVLEEKKVSNLCRIKTKQIDMTLNVIITINYGIIGVNEKCNFSYSMVIVVLKHPTGGSKIWVPQLALQGLILQTMR